jgi:L-lactate dehydrogenase complex protein LldG
VRREDFLARVATAALRASLPDEGAEPGPLPAMGPVDLVRLFRTRSVIVNAVVHGPVSRHNAPRAVIEIARGHSVESFVSWSDLPAPGVSSALTAQGWRRVELTGEPSDMDRIASADLGITGAAAGLAESGSVVLDHGHGRGRLVSLLPEVHVALLRVDDLHRTLAQWAADEADSVAGTANLVIVSGPSRTGDIELELNLGVHGPKHVHVVLIE